MSEQANFFNERDDQMWADLLSPNRRALLGGGAAAIAALGLGGTAHGQSATPAPGTPTPPRRVREPGKSPWGYDTYREPTPRPVSVRPGEQTLPTTPRAYTDIESYHAHIYFDEDTHQKAEQIRKWSAERFSVELGNWNLEPRGPHVTPSFYFGFTNDLLPVIVPWLQLNSLGLTILLHPNTDDPRADHLYYALWVNRSQPVNAYAMRGPAAGEPRVEQIYPNTRPTVKLEV
ncbi:DOPA 4,5-dioxygenase family protein [Sphingomonas sp.]|uniref:DOPA 4,5-dioxygenase family protein n=1 Tax=Sphingomonas sp. TaxID=28214 RepID=UPI002BBB5C56|nr:DOPA 4,5-dioxygenase family protein [Sphingomonas sp.]HWK36642.1 DOPA 4,5-dioxygenase family protein [Sphingomonas sp.]